MIVKGRLVVRGLERLYVIFNCFFFVRVVLGIFFFGLGSINICLEYFGINEFKMEF